MSTVSETLAFSHICLMLLSKINEIHPSRNGFRQKKTKHIFSMIVPPTNLIRSNELGELYFFQLVQRDCNCIYSILNCIYCTVLQVIIPMHTSIKVSIFYRHIKIVSCTILRPLPQHSQKKTMPQLSFFDWVCNIDHVKGEWGRKDPFRN